MKKLDVIIKDKNTLILAENGQEGDYIDLTSLSTIDQAQLESAIALETDKVYNNKLAAQRSLDKLENEQKLSEMKEQYTMQISELNNELKNEKSKLSVELNIQKSKLESEYNKQISQLNNELENEKNNLNNQLNIQKSQLEAEYNRKIYELNSRLETINKENASDIALKEEQLKNKYNEQINNLKSQFEEEISSLKSKLDKNDAQKNLEIEKEKNNANYKLNQKDLEIASLNQKLLNKQMENELNEKNIKSQYEMQLKLKDEQVAYYKDLKTKMSTKMVGETLEQHCLIEFNKVRMMSFPNAYFEKDNKISETGSKGDFIYKECAEDGTEIISIMFEMKNEMDSTEKKHTNESFLKELDKDRREKNCEYAVLVSMLEADNELYNQGIVDVSYLYEKMYVIRPQFFIPLISILRNAALQTVKYKQEMKEYKNQNIDITNFEEKMEAFKTGFSKNYKSAVNNFNAAIEEIDKTITHLNKVKQSLTTSANQLRLANEKADDLTIKKLTWGNPTMAAKFKELDKEKEE